MKRGILLLACVLLWSLAASAQDDYGENRIGIFADIDGLVNEVEVQAGTPLEVYLLIINPTGSGLMGGAEWSLVSPDNMTVWGWSYPMAGVLALANPPNFMVVWTPVPNQTVNHVMTFIITPADSDPGVFYIGEFDRPSLPGGPCYLDVDPDGDHSDDEIIALVPYPNGMGMPTFAINGGALPTVAASWGEVKSLFK